MAQNLRDHLIATAARLIGERGSAGIGVRDIAREAQVADGVLYNYFEDKDDLLAQALLAHVAAVMAGTAGTLEPGAGTVAGNLRSFIDTGLSVLGRVVPAFAGMLSQPGVLRRFHAMVGGDAAFDPAAGPGPPGQAREPADQAGAGTPDEGGIPDEGGEANGLPAILTRYLRAEQRLGRISATADIEAAASLVVGAMHGQVLPRVLFSPPGAPLTAPGGLAERMARTVLSGIAP